MEFVSDLVRKLKPYFAEMLDGLITGAVKFALLRVNGDVVIEGAARRIKGDFSSTPISNRVAFQSSLDNGNTFVFALPSGSNTQTNFTATNGKDPDNSARIQIAAGPSDGVLRTSSSGTGTAIPLRLQIGITTGIELDTSGNINLSPVNRVFLKNCTSPPSDTPVGGGYWFVQAGALKYKGSAGTVTTIASA